MCISPKIPDPKPAPIILSSPRSEEGLRAGDAEARMRRARSSAAGRILTSPIGIPSGAGTARLGAPA